MSRRIGILPLGRPTFDVPFAEENFKQMLALLGEQDIELVGSQSLLMDGEAAQEAINELKEESLDFLLVLQVTFTDASVIVEATNQLKMPMGIWAIPEPRLGGRLRLNSFCGLNLASHSLGLNGIDFGWMYCSPESDKAGKQLSDLLNSTGRREIPAAANSTATPSHQTKELVNRLKEKKIACLGDAPDGFFTCHYDPERLSSLTGTKVDKIELSELFSTAGTVPDNEVAEVSAKVSELIDNQDSLDAEQLDRSLRLKSALNRIQEKGQYDAFAIRCWPETFTEYGGAVCGPVSMMGEARVPCACEADVYGALTQICLQELADQPVFLIDIVDMDVEDQTGVLWHCGQAPISMAEPDVVVEGTIHTNRKMPLLFEFPLKAGRVTLVRISQSNNEPKLILASGEMLKRPMAFTGTSGVIRFDNGLEETLDGLIGSRMEHHMTLVYGDHMDSLMALAAELNLPVQVLGQH